MPDTIALSAPLEELNELAYSIRNSDFKRSETLASQVLDRCEPEDELERARALRTLALARSRTDLEEGYKLALDALVTFRERHDDDGICQTLMVVSNYHNTKGESESSLKACKEAFNRAMEAHNYVIACLSLYNVGVTMEHRDDYESARKYYLHSADLATEHKLEERRVMALNSYAFIRVMDGHCEEAIRLLDQTLPALERFGNIQSVIDGISSYIDALTRMGRYSIAVRTGENGLKFAKKHNFSHYAWVIEMEMAKAHLHLQERAQSARIARSGLKKVQSISHAKAQSEFHQLLAQVHAGANRYAKAYSHLAAAKEFSDRMAKEGREAALRELRSGYDIGIARADAAYARDRTREIESLNHRLTETIQELRETQTKLHIQACTDMLTGVLNRRAFMEEGTVRIQAAHQSEGPIALLMLDLDHFKAVNDTHGHQVGDAVLARTAETIQALIAPLDLFARLGGEEFVILMSNTTADKATQFAAGVLNAIRTLDFGDIRPGLRLTASIGLATSEGESSALSAMLARADNQLYEAKEKGRDRWMGPTLLFPT